MNVPNDAVPSVSESTLGHGAADRHRDVGPGLRRGDAAGGGREHAGRDLDAGRDVREEARLANDACVWPMPVYHMRPPSNFWHHEIG